MCSYADVADKWLTLAMGEFVAESVGLRVIKNQPVSGAPGNLLLAEPRAPTASPAKTAEFFLHPEKQFAEDGIDFQHLGFLHVDSASILLTIRPMEDGFSRQIFAANWMQELMVVLGNRG